MHRKTQMGSILQAYSVTTKGSFRNTSYERMNITRRVCILLYELTHENQLQMNDTHQAICDIIPLTYLLEVLLSKIINYGGPINKHNCKDQ